MGLFEAVRADPEDALVFVNLIQDQTPEQPADNVGVHPRKMMRAMADGVYGPSSTFVHETIGSYEPSGWEAMPTVPILDRLRARS